MLIPVDTSRGYFREDNVRRPIARLAVPVLVNPLHDYFREDHLRHVVSEMERRGAPILRAHFDGEVWHAREGTHRLRAAKILGLAPILRTVPWWRTRAALERARYAAILRAHSFERIVAI